MDSPDVDALSFTIDELLNQLDMPEQPADLGPEHNALVWLQRLEAGGAVPDSPTLIGMLRGLLDLAQRPSSSPALPLTLAGAPAAAGVVATLELYDTGTKFPHIVDTRGGTLTTENAEWQQCKNKMTHIGIELKDAAGQPLRGVAVQPGGLDLRLTLHKVVGDTAEPLNNSHNPRGDGLFKGRAKGPFESTVKMMETRHEFRFHCELLSSDIDGAKIFVQVAPIREDLAANGALVVRTRPFISRARDPNQGGAKRPRPEPTSAADDAAAAGGYADLSGGFPELADEVHYRNMSTRDEDDDDDEPPDAARVRTCRASNARPPPSRLPSRKSARAAKRAFAFA